MSRAPAPVDVTATLSIVLLSSLTAAAQSDDPATEGELITVSGVEYAFAGLPTSVPAGTSLGFSNNGAEVHEMFVARIGDGVTQTLDEILSMEEDPVATGLVEIITQAPLVAGPVEAAVGSVLLDREGHYVAVCFIPQGLTYVAVLEQAMAASSAEELPEDVLALLHGTPHVELGMVQEFTVTAAGTEPGPLPEAAEETEEPMAEESPAAES